MNQIDRLIIKAKRMTGHMGKQLVLAMVDRKDDSWSAVVHLWDGVDGHRATVETTTHASADAAVQYIQQLAWKYPNSRDLPVIIDDV